MANYKAEIVTKWQESGGNYEPIMPDVLAWQDETGQPVENIKNALPAYTIQATVTDTQLTAIQNDPAYTVLWSQEIPEDDTEPQPIADYTEQELASLKTELETFYYSDIPALVTQDTLSPETITANLKDAQLRSPWEVGVNAALGAIYLYGDDVENLFEVIQAHTTQADWSPPIAHSLFKRFHEPTDDPWPWVQPQGAHDAYPIGARVLHDGYTWENTINANVWQPGVTGWTNLTPPPPTDEWAVGIAYTVNDEVVYNGVLYRCLQAHTSQAGWTPPVVPALWAII